MQFGLFQPVHKRRKNCKAKFLTIHITLIEAHGPRLILIIAGPCAAGLEDVFSVNSGSYNYGHYHSCATQKCYVKCIHMALKYFFQSYFEILLEKRKWQLKNDANDSVYCENVGRNGWQGRAGLGWCPQVCNVWTGVVMTATAQIPSDDTTSQPPARLLFPELSSN